MYVETIQRERWPLTNRYTTNMPARELTLQNISFHDVARLKSHEACFSRAIGFWKTVLVGSARLTRPMPRRLDLKRLNVFDL